MKAKLIFDLPEDKEEYKAAVNGKHYYLALWDFSQDVIRKYYKHGIPDDLKDADKFLEKLRDEFFEILDGYEIKL